MFLPYIVPCDFEDCFLRYVKSDVFNNISNNIITDSRMFETTFVFVGTAEGDAVAPG